MYLEWLGASSEVLGRSLNVPRGVFGVPWWGPAGIGPCGALGPSGALLGSGPAGPWALVGPCGDRALVGPLQIHKNVYFQPLKTLNTLF